MEVLLGAPPPNPPADVPPLPETMNNEKVLSVRERMEQHRVNPACAGCHQLMDPIGLSLENFDAIGRWRETDGGVLFYLAISLFVASIALLIIHPRKHRH